MPSHRRCVSQVMKKVLEKGRMADDAGKAAFEAMTNIGCPLRAVAKTGGLARVSREFVSRRPRRPSLCSPPVPYLHVRLCSAGLLAW